MQKIKIMNKTFFLFFLVTLLTILSCQKAEVSTVDDSDVVCYAATYGEGIYKAIMAVKAGIP